MAVIERGQHFTAADVAANLGNDPGDDSFALGGDIELIFDNDRAGGGEIGRRGFNLRCGTGDRRWRRGLGDGFSVRTADAEKRNQDRKFKFHKPT